MVSHVDNTGLTVCNGCGAPCGTHLGDEWAVCRKCLIEDTKTLTGMVTLYKELAEALAYRLKVVDKEWLLFFMKKVLANPPALPGGISLASLLAGMSQAPVDKD